MPKYRLEALFARFQAARDAFLVRREGKLDWARDYMALRQRWWAWVDRAFPVPGVSE